MGEQPDAAGPGWPLSRMLRLSPLFCFQYMPVRFVGSPECRALRDGPGEGVVHRAALKMPVVFVPRGHPFTGRWAFHLWGERVTSWSDHGWRKIWRVQPRWFARSPRQICLSQRLVVGAFHLRIFCGAAQQDAKVSHFIEMKCGDAFGSGDGDKVGTVHIVEIEAGTRIG